MPAPELSAPPIEPHLQPVDLHRDEVALVRTEVLGREAERLRGDGWRVEFVGGDLIANRRELRRSQLDRMLFSIGGFLAAAYAAMILFPDQVGSLPSSENAYLVCAIALGAVLAHLTRGRAVRERRVSVGVDGRGRPFTVDLDRRDF